MKDLSRSVKLFCPICGGQSFKSLDVKLDNLSEADDNVRIECQTCKTIQTKKEIIEGNQDVINANIQDIANEAKEEIRMDIKKAFDKAFKRR